MSALHIHAPFLDAVDELHPQPIAPLGLPELIHPHDMRMFEVGHHLGLAAKAPDGFWARGEIRRQQLQCVTPFERRVLHFIHLAHAAAAQQPHDAILPKAGADAE